MNQQDTSSGGTYLHYNNVHTDYTLSEDELNRLAYGGQNIWKDFCLICFSIGIAAILNGVNLSVNQKTAFVLTIDIFLNYLFGVVGFALGIFFLIAWIRTYVSVKTTLEEIKKKPKFRVEVTSTSSGPQCVLTL